MSGLSRQCCILTPWCGHCNPSIRNSGLRELSFCSCPFRSWVGLLHSLLFKQISSHPLLSSRPAQQDGINATHTPGRCCSPKSGSWAACRIPLLLTQMHTCCCPKRLSPASGASSAPTWEQRWEHCSLQSLYSLVKLEGLCKNKGFSRTLQTQL